MSPVGGYRFERRHYFFCFRPDSFVDPSATRVWAGKLELHLIQFLPSEDIGGSDVFPDLLLTTLVLENEIVGVHENRPLVRLTRTGQTFYDL